MTKRILSLLLVLVLALSLCACNSIKDLFGGTSDDPGVQDVDPNTPAHEQLMTEVNNRLVWAAEQEDVGMTFQSEYLYGVAQAEISSLRLCIDTVLWLMGEGDNLSQVIAPVGVLGYLVLFTADQRRKKLRKYPIRLLFRLHKNRCIRDKCPNR